MSRPPRRDRIVRTTLTCIAIAMVALTVGSCTRMTAGNAVLAAPRVGQPVQWDKCRFTADTNIKVPAGAQCGFIAVPVDYSNPQGAVARLAMIRFPATKDKIGSLVINPGGPGESGIETAVGLVSTLPRQVRERFDLVGFDPRGVASSRPAVWCNTDEENDRLRALNQVDYSPEGVQRIEDETKDYVERCLEKTGKEFLANIGTVNVARDLDAIRAGLGDDKLTYLGYSYGTRIGSAYAEAFPQNIRAMILDGAVDPNADPVEEDLRQVQAFQGAFDDFAADCAKDEDCPLGTDPVKAVEVYHSLVDPLVEQPGQDQGSARVELQRRDRRHHHGAVFADVLDTTSTTACRIWSTDAATSCWAWRICTCGGTPPGITPTPPTPGWRSTASTSRRSPTARW